MDEPDVNWKIVETLKQFHRKEDPSSLMLLELGSCELCVLYRDRNLVKVLKNLYSIFKKYPAKRLDHQEAIDLQESHENKSTAYLFPLKYFGHRWLENGKAVKRLIELQPYLK